jgi:KDO2-lipid IV(A) lauroyltransferase
MQKLSKSISYLIEYLLLKGLQNLLRMFPRQLELKIGALCGVIIHNLGIYRTIVRVNLEHVGIWDRQECNRITLNLYKNIGRYAVDFLRPPHPIPRHTVHGFDKIEPVLESGKGTIVILAHMGNWELLTTVFGKQAKRINVVAQNMNNKIVDKWLLEKRNASSVSTIYTRQAMRKMLEIIRNGGIIAILIDQYSQRHGIPAPFLGKEAKTVRTVAGIVRKTGCSVVSVTSILQPDNTYDIRLFTVPEPDLEGLSGEEEIAAYLKVHNDVLSEQIRTCPEHWFGWFHRRFKEYTRYRS